MCLGQDQGLLNNAESACGSSEVLVLGEGKRGNTDWTLQSWRLISNIAAQGLSLCKRVQGLWAGALHAAESFAGVELRKVSAQPTQEVLGVCRLNSWILSLGLHRTILTQSNLHRTERLNWDGDVPGRLAVSETSWCLVFKETHYWQYLELLDVWLYFWLYNETSSFYNTIILIGTYRFRCQSVSGVT